MKGIGDDKAEDTPKKPSVVAPKAVEKKPIVSQANKEEDVAPTKVEKKFEGKGLA
ncbi:MAG: hypothetical protein WCL18_06970 [bacterium]